MSRLSPTRAVWLAWALILAALLARAWWVWSSGPGPLPWGKPWNDRALETGADADRKGLDDGDELERDSRWEP